MGSTMYCDFTTTTHGKWILAGEHAVLRGGAALVYPDFSKSLCLNYVASGVSPCKFNARECSGEVVLKLLQIVLAHGLSDFGLSVASLPGEFHLTCDIPVGVGLGSSAAISVATARWFAAQHLIGLDEVHEFARKLENIFHVQSSGLDLAGVAATQGVYFQNGQASNIVQTWQPNFKLSSCGSTSSTAECINKVQKLWQSNSELALGIDLQMKDSVALAYSALTTSFVSGHAEKDELIHAINQASDCFKRWGLVSAEMEQHMQELCAAGAAAVKPTGSGGGGFVVSLW